MLRKFFFVGFGLGLLAMSSAQACTLDEIQKANMRENFCANSGSVSVPGCTAKIMQSQAGDQLKEIALARRCGFKTEADQLEKYYKATTPLVAKLYECVDQPLDQKGIEQLARQDVDKNLQSLPEGCPDDLKDKLAKRLPKLIAVDKTSYNQARAIAEQLNLDVSAK